jgi:hypothetical protein
MEGRDLEILQHSLGLDEYGHGRPYRNHFVTGPGSKDFEACCSLTGRGLMEDHGMSPLYGGDHCFTVTDAGRGYVREHSPKPPKLTRSQRRYLAFLDADSGLTFAEWLGIGAERAW